VVARHSCGEQRKKHARSRDAFDAALTLKI
jgi:hypothetical protein